MHQKTSSRKGESLVTKRSLLGWRTGNSGIPPSGDAVSDVSGIAAVWILRYAVPSPGTAAIAGKIPDFQWLR